MLVEFFRSGAIDSRPSSKCGILFVCFVCLFVSRPAMRHRRLYRCHRWMNVGWILDNKGGCIFCGALVEETWVLMDDYWIDCR